MQHCSYLGCPLRTGSFTLARIISRNSNDFHKFPIEIIFTVHSIKDVVGKKHFSAVGCLTCKEKKENTSKCKYTQKFHYLCHCVLKPWFVHPHIIFTIIISHLAFKLKYNFSQVLLLHQLFRQIIVYFHFIASSQ